MTLTRHAFLLTIISSAIQISVSILPPEESSRSDEIQCSICLEALFASNVTMNVPGCPHSYHRDCIIEWVRRGHISCPVCRGDIGPALRRYLPKQSKAATVRAFVVFTGVWCVGMVVFLFSKYSATSYQTYSGIFILSFISILIWFYVLVSDGVHMENADPLIDLLHR